MATINITKGKLGEEDIQKGVGSFTRTTSTGGNQTLTKVSASTWRPGVVHIDDYDADPTGATDSTVAFQNAVDALAGTQGQTGVNSKGVGGRVILGAGHYLIAGAHIEDAGANYNITIEGEGMWATTIENTDTSGGHTLTVAGQSTSLLQSVRIKDLAIVGNSSAGAGIVIQSAVRSVILENVWIEDFAGGGVRVNTTVHNLSIKNCVIRASDASAWHTISNGNDKADFVGIRCEGTAINTNIRIVDCDIQGWFRGIGFGGKTRGATVRDCRIRDCVQGIRAKGLAGGYAEILGLTIADNVFDNNGYDIEVDNDGGGEQLTNRARGVMISGNYLGEAVNLDQTYANGTELDEDGEAAHIRIKRTYGFNITGNVFALGTDGVLATDYLIDIDADAKNGWIWGNTSDAQASIATEVNVHADATSVWGQTEQFATLILPFTANGGNQFTLDGYFLPTAGAKFDGEVLLHTDIVTEPSDATVIDPGDFIFYREEGSNEIWVKCMYADGTTVKDGKIADLA